MSLKFNFKFLTYLCVISASLSIFGLEKGQGLVFFALKKAGFQGKTFNSIHSRAHTMLTPKTSSTQLLAVDGKIPCKKTSTAALWSSMMMAGRGLPIPSHL